VGALASPEVGKFVNENFCSSFQKVATFKIVGGAKQGGNVAAYFCSPDGRVLHAVAGPVDANTFLHEAKWVVETTRKAMKEAGDDGAKFKAYFREAHARKVRDEFGLAIEPVSFDPPDAQDPKDALTYRDPSGQPLAPRLPPPPIDGPDVRLDKDELALRQANAAKAAGFGAGGVADRKGGRWVLPNQGKVSQLLAGHAMAKIETVYGTVFENILGEKISTKPVEVDRPFSWVEKDGNRRVVAK
jgi:hypothetical protein